MDFSSISPRENSFLAGQPEHDQGIPTPYFNTAFPWTNQPQEFRNEMVFFFQFKHYLRPVL